MKDAGARRLMPPSRHFPPPWSIEDIGAAFVVRDRGAQNHDIARYATIKLRRY